MKTKKIDYFATSPEGTTKYLYSTVAYRRCKDAVKYLNERAKKDTVRIVFDRNPERVPLKDCKITARFDHNHKDYS
jgi:hypothetical protein